MTDGPLQKTPLHAAHVALGAKMVPFGGWDMPVQYEGIMAEHRAVRTAAGMFDVSHMGEVVLRGPRAVEIAQRLCTNAVSKLADGAAAYTVMCRPSGGIVDDCIVYRRAADDVYVIVNASNIDKDLAWIREIAGSACDVIDESPETGLIAVQGPTAVGIVAKLAGEDLGARLPSFHHGRATVAGVSVMAARTGYTGEDGFELACAAKDTVALWNALHAAGVAPIGLGARDTLRLEARLALYGNDLDETTSPLEAGLGWVVKWDNDFIGKDALAKQKADGVTRKLAGFVIDGRGIARHGYAIVDAAGTKLGEVTSGTTGPTVGKAIGLGYVPTALAQPGTTLTIDCRGKATPAVVHQGPFYKRSQG